MVRVGERSHLSFEGRTGGRLYRIGMERGARWIVMFHVNTTSAFVDGYRSKRQQQQIFPTHVAQGHLVRGVAMIARFFERQFLSYFCVTMKLRHLRSNVCTDLWLTDIAVSMAVSVTESTYSPMRPLVKVP